MNYSFLKILISRTEPANIHYVSKQGSKTPAYYMKIIYLLIIGMLVISCKNPSIDPPKKEKEAPKALQKKEYDYSLSKRGKDDIVTSLYNGLVDTTESLKKLENEINAIYEGKADSLEAFLDYKNQNNDYYSSADNHINQIKDSVLKIKMAQYLKNSIARYDALKSSHEGLLNDINLKDQSLSDLHTALRVLSTIPIMERYQKDYLPSQRPLRNLDNEINRVINKLDKEVKKHGE